MSDFARLLPVLIACGERVRDAVARAEHHRLAEVVGLGADGADTTHIDRLAEEAALSFLESAEPRMNVLSEEVGFLDRGSALTVIVDPIDATNNATAAPDFIPEGSAAGRVSGLPLTRSGHVFGFPYYAFSAGVVFDGQVVAGCVVNLPTGEVFTGAIGDGARLDGARVRARRVTTLGDARVALIRPETDTAWKVLRPITVAARRIRITGCSALDLALISCGTLDALVNPNRYSPGGWGEKIVDYAGVLPLLRESGALLTAFDGSALAIDLDLQRRTPLLAAATPELHSVLREVIDREPWDVETVTT